MHVVPSDSLALFVRGSSRRAEREIRWVLKRGVPERELWKLLDGALQVLEQPLTQTALDQVGRSLGYRTRFKTGGVGRGNRRRVPWVEVGGMALPIGYFLRFTSAREVICSGISFGNELTFVRADRWIPSWKDMPIEQAESELLLNYLRAFGPATISDFALWTGIRISDAKEIWPREAASITQVEVEDRKAAFFDQTFPNSRNRKLTAPLCAFFHTSIRFFSDSSRSGT